jgi:hypothetical protein
MVKEVVDDDGYRILCVDSRVPINGVDGRDMTKVNPDATVCSLTEFNGGMPFWWELEPSSQSLGE